MPSLTWAYQSEHRNQSHQGSSIVQIQRVRRIDFGSTDPSEINCPLSGLTSPHERRRYDSSGTRSQAVQGERQVWDSAATSAATCPKACLQDIPKVFNLHYFPSRFLIEVSWNSLVPCINCKSCRARGPTSPNLRDPW
jgi:hypothetical protein